MPYTPPAGNAIDFEFGGSAYTPPAGNEVDFEFGDDESGVLLLGLFLALFVGE